MRNPAASLSHTHTVTIHILSVLSQTSKRVCHASALPHFLTYLRSCLLFSPIFFYISILPKKTKQVCHLAEARKSCIETERQDVSEVNVTGAVIPRSRDPSPHNLPLPNYGY